MPLLVATHHGAFHADDVLAFSLVRAFVDPAAQVVRSRAPQDWERADIVVDVGGVYDPGRGRFDHHQKEYQGPLSAAGMVLLWLEETGRVEAGLAAELRARLVEYVDDVDNGRVEPKAGVPCFASIVHLCNQGAEELEDFDRRFLDAVRVADLLVAGLRSEHEEREEASAVVRAAMDEAERRGSNLLRLPRYVRWKPAYFAMGGEEHPTEYVIMPGLDGSSRAIAIPPAEGSFGKKRPLPEAWAGLVDEELVVACGVEGARFCHKNCFICVFDTEEHLLEALTGAGLVR
jgi:uncharacterized UPF0160 family protein